MLIYLNPTAASIGTYKKLDLCLYVLSLKTSKITGETLYMVLKSDRRLGWLVACSGCQTQHSK